MIRARLKFEGEGAAAAASSLHPDNLPGMRVLVGEETFEVEFSAERAGRSRDRRRPDHEREDRFRSADQRGGEVKFHLEASFRLSADAAEAEKAR